MSTARRRRTAINVCPICNDDSAVITDFQNGNELCSRCGLILQARIITEDQEWRNFSNNDGQQIEKSRVGEKAEEWFDGTQAGTSIVGGDLRMLRAHEVATQMQGKDRQLKLAFSNLNRIKQTFYLKDVVMERCKEMAKLWIETDATKGHTSEKEMLAVVYLACREAKQTRTLKDLADPYPQLSPAELGRAVNRLKKTLVNAKLSGNTSALAAKAANNFGGTTIEAASELVSRYCSALLQNLVERPVRNGVQALAEGMSVRACEQLSKGYRPSSLAAACLFLALQLFGVAHLLENPISAIAQVAKTSEGTVRGCCKELKPLAAYLIPPGISFPKSIDSLKS